MSDVFVQGGGAGHIFSPLQIRTGNMDVLLAGTVITADARNLEFQVKDLRVVLTFIGDGTGGAPKMEPYKTGDSLLVLNLHNFTNNLGTGTTSPIQIGKLFGRNLFMAFMVYALSEQSSKVVHYTFLLGGTA